MSEMIEQLVRRYEGGQLTRREHFRDRAGHGPFPQHHRAMA